MADRPRRSSVPPDATASDAHRLRALRETLKLSQRELADEWSVSPAAIAKWETGSNPVPGPVRKLLSLYEQDLTSEREPAETQSFLMRGFNSFVAYGLWVFFRRVFGAGAFGGAQAAFARQFANHIMKHRGLLMKLGQRAVYLDPLLDANERDALAELREPSPQLTTAAVHRIFRETFGIDPTSLLDAWDPKPVRRGSIGQVHRARHKDGRWVAVKIQYPDARRTIEADFAAAPMLDQWLTTMWPAQEPGIVFEELRERFLEECDYEHEARSLRRFGQLWADHPQIVVPQPIDELCKGPVLTTEWCDGLAWAPWQASAQIADRVRAAEVIWDVSVGSVYRHGVVNADPHRANFLFLPDRIGCIDFGCTKELTAPFNAFFVKASRAICERRWRDLWRLSVEHGLARPDGEPDTIPRMCAWMWLPMLVSPFRVTREYLLGLVTSLSWRTSVRETTNLSRDTVFLHGVQMSAYGMLADLDVSVDYRSRLGACLYPNETMPEPFRPEELAGFGIDLDRLHPT